MILEDYCSYEVAKLLKEKGFEGICDYAYSNKGNYFEIDRSNFDEVYCLRPTLQMAMKWLREEKNIIIVVQPEYFNIELKCSAWGVDIWDYEGLRSKYPSYEKAVEAALKYSLENLI